MLPEIGYGVLVVAFIAALYSVAAAIHGDRSRSAGTVKSARRAMLLLWPLITLGAAILIYLLVNNRFEVAYVYEVTSRSMPTYLKVTAWWGGQAGSLLFWSWLMSALASLVTLRRWDRDREFLPWVIVVTSITTAFLPGAGDLLRKPICPLLAEHGRRRNHFHAAAAERHPVHAGRWPRPEPASASSGHDHPSADALSGIRVLRHTLRLRHGSADHGPQRRPLDTA